jgi:hypothetical protein
VAYGGVRAPRGTIAEGLEPASTQLRSTLTPALSQREREDGGGWPPKASA